MTFYTVRDMTYECDKCKKGETVELATYTQADLIRFLRQDGWTFDLKARTCLCPACSGKAPAKAAPKAAKPALKKKTPAKKKL